MEEHFKELVNGTNVRSNLSELRKLLKEDNDAVETFLSGNQDLFLGFLSSEDAKTRKNVALLFGDLNCQWALGPLYHAYKEEEILFVKPAYLSAIARIDASSLVDELKERRAKLISSDISVEDSKHVEEEIREINKIILKYDGIMLHHVDYKAEGMMALLSTNRTQREVVRRMVEKGKASIHPLGVLVEEVDLPSILLLRTYRDIAFLVEKDLYLSSDPIKAAKELWEAGLLTVLKKLHKDDHPFVFRLECKTHMDLETKSKFATKFCGTLEKISEGTLVNSVSDYEIEIRFVETKEGKFFPSFRTKSLKQKRFAYRKNTISSSMHPSTAALVVEIAKDYMKEDAQIMDPFCGVGTLLIERDLAIPAREMYATDIFGEAITFGRENARLAGERINFIHRDFFDFKHDYLFDEIITDMPIRGKKTKEELDDLYANFFRKAEEILTSDGIIVMYTNEMGLVKKQLRIQKNFRLLQETCINIKNDTYVLVLGKR